MNNAVWESLAKYLDKNGGGALTPEQVNEYRAVFNGGGGRLTDFLRRDGAIEPGSDGEWTVSCTYWDYFFTAGPYRTFLP